MKISRSAAVWASCFIAVGCAKRPPEPPPPQPENLAAIATGYDAFMAGDRAALESQIQTLAARLPADETNGGFADCSTRGYEMRRVERARRKLQYLDNPTLASMGEDERYVFFQQLVDDRFQQMFEPREASAGVDDVGGPTNFECQTAPGYAQSMAMEQLERDAVYNAGRMRVRVWLQRLRQLYGEQLNARMQSAAKELLEYSLRPTGAPWEAPQALP